MAYDNADNSLYVRTDENKLVLIDTVNSTLTYEGRANFGTDTDDSRWQIKRIYRIGTVVYQDYANNGKYNLSWEERGSAFPAPQFFNTLSTNFDGINDFVNFGDVFDEFDVGNQWSMSFWINPDNIASQRCIYSKVTQDVNVYGFSIQITTSGKIFLQCRSSTYLLSHTGSTLTIATGVWQHLVVTYNGGNNLNGFRVYLNSAVGTTPSSSAMAATLYTGQSAQFGSRGNSFYYSGNMNEITFWEKALSQTEVAEIYNSGSPIDPEGFSFSSNLLNWYRMGNGDTFPTIFDNNGSDNGTMTNMTASNFEADVP